MNIGVIIHGDLQMISGGFLYDRLLVNYLRERGDKVEVIALKWRRYVGSLSDNLSLRLFARLARSHFDLLLQDELAHPSLFYLNRHLKGLARRPLVAVVHHLRSCEQRPSWQNSLYRRVEASYLNSVDGFIFTSSTTGSTVEPLLRRQKPCVVAFPGADHLGSPVTEEEIMRRALTDSSTLEILFLGNVSRRKQLHLLLHVLNRLKGEWRLTIVGSLSADPSYAVSLQRQVQRSGAAGRITFTGSLSDVELPAVLKRAHVLVVPSSYEGFGIVYLEAMAFGLPAIGTTSGGAKEIIRDGYNGFLVQPDDGWAITLRLQNLMDNRTEIARMGFNALTTYRAHPRWHDSFSPVYNFLHSFS